MKHRSWISLILAILMLISCLACSAMADSIETRYATVSYDDKELLKTFNRKVKLKSVGFSFGKKVSTNIQSEVRKKINLLNGRVQEILEMKLPNIKFKIVLLSDKEKVQKIYRDLYHRDVNFIAFYSPTTKTAYFSVKNLKLRVYAHEIAHATINHYFDKDPPVKIHEMLAQYVETQI